MIKYRIAWIDWAKTIGIFLVILGHVPVQLDIKWAITGIHMPLFFIISGYLASNTSKCVDKKMQIKKIVNGILIPYLIYCTIITLLYVAQKGGQTILPNILTANYSALVGDYTSICPLWFLVSLITIKVIDILIGGHLQLQYKCLIFTIISITFSYIQLPNYYMLKTTILCLPFYYLGCNVKVRGYLDEGGKISKIPMFVLIICFIVSLVFSYINGTVYLTTCDVGKSYILFLMSSIMGSISMFGILSRFRTTHKLIEIISEGTLLIMSLHYLMIKPLITIIPSNSVGGWIVDSSLILAITSMLILVAKRYCPVLIGKKSVI